jgi:hypothetical protein
MLDPGSGAVLESQRLRATPEEAYQICLECRDR